MSRCRSTQKHLKPMYICQTDYKHRKYGIYSGTSERERYQTIKNILQRYLIAKSKTVIVRTGNEARFSKFWNLRCVGPNWNIEVSYHGGTG